jgi:hypothetical protein
MPFNGAGTFTRIYSWVTDAANGIFVSSTRTDADTNDIATGLSNVICKDGQSTPTANIPMGGFKITGLGLGTATTDAARVDNANASVCEFRLTLTSGTPVTTADVTGAATVYCCPYVGNHIALYDGTSWHMRTSSEFSLALGTLTNGKPYDVFCYDNAGVPTLEFLVWTSDTARATALAYQDGVLVKSGATTRRYLGTFYTTAATTTEDSRVKRYLWNYYNRVTRPMKGTNGEVATWTYTTATVRQANANTANQMNFVVGANEDRVEAQISMAASNSSANVAFAVGVGLDDTANFTGSTTAGNMLSKTVSQVVNLRTPVTAGFWCFPGVGRHFLSWNEYSAATGTTTWDPVPPTGDVSGIFGWLRG